MAGGSVACKLISRSCSRTVPIAVVGLLATFTAKRGEVAPGANGRTTARLAWSYPLVTTIARSPPRAIGTPAAAESSFGAVATNVKRGMASRKSGAPTDDRNNVDKAVPPHRESGVPGMSSARQIPPQSAGVIQRQIAARTIEIGSGDVNREEFVAFSTKGALDPSGTGCAPRHVVGGRPPCTGSHRGRRGGRSATAPTSSRASPPPNRLDHSSFGVDAMTAAT